MSAPSRGPGKEANPPNRTRCSAYSSGYCHRQCSRMVRPCIYVRCYVSLHTGHIHVFVAMLYCRNPPTLRPGDFGLGLRRPGYFLFSLHHLGGFVVCSMASIYAWNVRKAKDWLEIKEIKVTVSFPPLPFWHVVRWRVTNAIQFPSEPLLH